MWLKRQLAVEQLREADRSVLRLAPDAEALGPLSLPPEDGFRQTPLYTLQSFTSFTTTHRTRKNGEWFDLDTAHVSAFKRRKFM